ncbi:hypothetical protein [Sandarakinorhabdus sp.]|uniref:c-type cytochrome n=1 Tax=Sandarakinorhabdus sp. TaxID=1916663 RepID=UPI00286D890A|nr:hypothetical protein [Sandarakinorhabdus sp.]
MKFLLVAVAAIAVAGAPPDWLYPAPSGPAPVRPAPDAPQTLPGSPVTLTFADLRNGRRAVDWFPVTADPVPDIVMNAVPQAQYACGFCHLPRGQGRPENASIAGLPAEYIIAQTEAMRSGTRRAAVAGWLPTQAMREAVQHANPDQIAEAAAWFSRQPFESRVKVVESATVPAIAPLGFIWAARPGPPEPIAGRIIEVPDDEHVFEKRDPRSIFTAYVPPGSIARGRAIAMEQGCMDCHEQLLNSWGPGRSPSYILRQLLAFKSRARSGESAEPMQVVVDQLDLAQMVAVTAWMADGAKP